MSVHGNFLVYARNEQKSHLAGVHESSKQSYTTPLGRQLGSSNSVSFDGRPPGDNLLLKA